MQEGDAADPRAGGCGCVSGLGDASDSAQQPLDLIQKILREGCDGCGPVGKHAAQSLRHGDHPLPHGHRRNHVIDEMGGGLPPCADRCRTDTRRGSCRRRPRQTPGRSPCSEHGRIRSRGCRTRDSRGARPRRSPARAARRLPARRASSRGPQRPLCGAASSLGGGARNAVTARGRRASGGGDRAENPVTAATMGGPAGGRQK